MSRTRTETDSFGPIEVPETALWGAQTARSLRFLPLASSACRCLWFTRWHGSSGQQPW